MIIKSNKPEVLWFTGLSGSGKSTLADCVAEKLQQQNYQTYVLDGDKLRRGLCNDLGFSEKDRKENIRRIAEVAKLLLEQNITVIVALISPYEEDRQSVKALIGTDNVIEIYCNCPLEICEQRDVKGLYRKVRQGQIKNFTGIDAPYEPPLNPNISLDTSLLSVEKCVQKVLELHLLVESKSKVIKSD